MTILGWIVLPTWFLDLPYTLPDIISSAIRTITISASKWVGEVRHLEKDFGSLRIALVFHKTVSAHPKKYNKRLL